eukprot:TRINITY_DN51203_c0_g1_i1.p1 TRINITY_DN51203_c0_g1~~TRINITY_DN51203_c0_g1_i1.p1  ORF type:complete len:598 (+),score=150.15 TRINITY_DN51203_c0_g1_i1:90-1796(+)
MDVSAVEASLLGLLAAEPLTLHELQRGLDNGQAIFQSLAYATKAELIHAALSLIRSHHFKSNFAALLASATANAAGLPQLPLPAPSAANRADRRIATDLGAALPLSQPLWPSAGQIPSEGAAQGCGPTPPARSKRAAPEGRQMGDVQGQVLMQALDPEGSRLIQRRLEFASPLDLMMVWKELQPELPRVIKDPQGSCVLAALVDHGTPEIREEIAGAVRGNAAQFAKVCGGNRVVQSLIVALPREQCEALVQELEGSVASLLQDRTGTHVVQKWIEKMPHLTTPIVSALTGKVAPLGCDSAGSHVLQKLLEHCSGNAEIAPVLEEVIASAKMLVGDQYGNYVVQSALRDPKSAPEIISRLRGNFKALAMHKYASNVVERMFEIASPQERDSVLDELCHVRGHESGGLLEVAEHKNGNYVIHKVFEVGDERQQRRVVELLRPHVTRLRSSPYGRHFVGRMIKAGLLYHKDRNGNPNPSHPCNAGPSQQQQQQGTVPWGHCIGPVTDTTPASSGCLRGSQHSPSSSPLAGLNNLTLQQLQAQALQSSFMLSNAGMRQPIPQAKPLGGSPF